MKIEFYFIESGDVLAAPNDTFFVMNNCVYSDNFKTTESQEVTVGFEDFIKERPDLDWRCVNDKS